MFRAGPGTKLIRIRVENGKTLIEDLRIPSKIEKAPMASMEQDSRLKIVLSDGLVHIQKHEAPINVAIEGLGTVKVKNGVKVVRTTATETFSHDFFAGDKLLFEASPRVGYHFAGWTYETKKSESLSFVLPLAGASVKAVFEKD